MEFDISSIFQKYVEEIQLSLKSDKNTECFTWIPVYILYHISVNYSYSEKDKQYIFNVILRRVRTTVVAVQSNKYFIFQMCVYG